MIRGLPVVGQHQSSDREAGGCPVSQNNFNLDFESFQLLLLEMAQQCAVDKLLQLVTSSLASNNNVVLARVWMLAPGDICDTCKEYAGCLDKSRCLHLMASRGFSIQGIVQRFTKRALFF